MAPGSSFAAASTDFSAATTPDITSAVVAALTPASTFGAVHDDRVGIGAADVDAYPDHRRVSCSVRVGRGRVRLRRAQQMAARAVIAANRRGAREFACGKERRREDNGGEMRNL